MIEFDDNDFWSELEATIVLLGPKEALLPSRENEFESIAKLLERNNVNETFSYWKFMDSVVLKRF